MSYRVRISESLLRPLPEQLRVRIRLELAQVAIAASEACFDMKRPPPPGAGAEALPVRPLPGGYWVSYDVNDAERIVKLLVVGKPKGGLSEDVA